MQVRLLTLKVVDGPLMERLMKQAFCRSLFVVMAFVCCLQAQTLKRIATIDLPGPKGERFDYLTMDDEDHYLLSAHLGPGILYVIDVGANKVVKAIPGVPGVTGLEYVPGLHKVYTSDWGEEKIGVVDLRSMTVIKRLATAAKPNGSAYAAPFHKVYVSNTLGKAVAIVDVDKDEIVKTLEFKSETGMPQFDSVGRKVYGEPSPATRYPPRPGCHKTKCNQRTEACLDRDARRKLSAAPLLRI